MFYTKIFFFPVLELMLAVHTFIGCLILVGKDSASVIVYIITGPIQCPSSVCAIVEIHPVELDIMGLSQGKEFTEDELEDYQVRF